MPPIEFKDFFILTPVLSLTIGGLLLIPVQILAGKFRLVVSYAISLLAVCIAILSTLIFLIPGLTGVISNYINIPLDYKLDTLAFNGHISWNSYSIAYTFVIVTCLLPFLILARGILKQFSLDLVEIYELILFSSAGLVLFVISNNLITSFVALELASLPLFVLVAIRRTEKSSIEAGLKYFLLSVIATAFFLLGIAFIYGATGTSDLSIMASYLAKETTLNEINVIYLRLGIAFISIGLLFKLGVFPFHGWVSDVYEGGFSIIVSLIASIVKVSIIGFSFKLLSVFNGDVYSKNIHTVIVLFSIISILYGNIAALTKRNIKSILAYSSIAHAGYMGLVLSLTSVKEYHVEASAAIFFYVLGYCLASLLAFGIVAYLEQYKGNHIVEIDDIKGLSSRSPLLSLGLSISTLSLAGIPPFIGFLW